MAIFLVHYLKKLRYEYLQCTASRDRKATTARPVRHRRTVPTNTTVASTAPLDPQAPQDRMAPRDLKERMAKTARPACTTVMALREWSVPQAMLDQTVSELS